MRRLIPIVLVVTGCGPGEIRPTPDDAIAEARVTEATLLATFHRDGEHWVSPVLDAPSAATVVGTMLEVAGDEPLELEARAVDTRDGPGPWLPLVETWREGRLRVARAELGIVAWSAQIRLPVEDAGRVIELIWSPVVPEERDPDARPYPVEPSRHALLPNLAAWKVRSREEWQARNPACSREDSRKTRLAVHHTAGSPGDPDAYDAKLRQIQAYHMDTNGWCDIGYHFLVSLDGTVWEGRELFDLGTHILEHNRANIGVSFIGCFHPSSDCAGITPQSPPDAMLTAGGEIIGVLSHIYELRIDKDTIKGHRDFSNTATSCPGDNLEARLDDLRVLATATLVQFEDTCGCDFTSKCDADCACDLHCEKEDGGCAAVAAPPWAWIAISIAALRRRLRR